MSIEELWEEVDEASITPERERESRLLALLERIKNAPEYLTSADFAYMAAYCLYIHPKRTQTAEIQAAFNAAIIHTFQLEPEHNLAKLYKGFHLFDIARYEEADNIFSKVVQDLLTDQQQIKVAELRLCCALYLNGASQSIHTLREFIREAKRVDEYDVLPIQLMNCLVKIVPPLQHDDIAVKIVDLISHFMAEIHQQEIFADELQILKAGLT